MTRGLEMMKSWRGFGALWGFFAAVMFCTASGRAEECAPAWLPGEALAGVNGTVFTVTAWDPDGSGSLSERVVVGGQFTVAGSLHVANIAAWDPQTGEWSTFGAGFNNRVFALASMPNGDLIAAGNFTVAGGVPASYIARWNTHASVWEPLGSGMNFQVASVVAMPNGDIIAGGRFSIAGGSPASSIARWNAATSTWSPIGGGIGGDVFAIVALENGDIVACGSFGFAGGVPATNIARWSSDSGLWSAMGGGLGFPSNPVHALCVTPAGDIVAGGQFYLSTPYLDLIARWDEASESWISMNPLGGNDAIRALRALPNGDVIAAGAFTTMGGQSINGIARWSAADGAWSPFGPGRPATVFGLEVLATGQVVAGGAVAASGFTPASNLAAWTDATQAWTALGLGTNNRVLTMKSMSDNSVVAGGLFTTIGGIEANRIARWRPSTGTWTPMGEGLDGSVNAIVGLPNGDVVAAGNFRSSGSTQVLFTARWDQLTEQWMPMGNGRNTIVTALLSFPDGRVLAAGSNNTFAVWSPTSDQWTEVIANFVGNSPHSPSIFALELLPDGDVVVAGRFSAVNTTLASNIVRWNPATGSWTALGAGLGGTGDPQVRAITILPDGQLVAGGYFATAGGLPASNVARWDFVSQTWTPMTLGAGADVVASLAALPDGNVIAAGTFTSGSSTVILRYRVPMWDTSSDTWRDFVARTDGPSSAVLVTPSGEVALAGSFASLDGAISAAFARYSGHPVAFIADHPQPVTIDAGDDLVLSAAPAFGYSCVTAQWFRDGVALADGDAGCTGGSVISGSSFTFPDPTDGTPAHFRITIAQASDSGSYSVVFANACGQVTSEPAVVLVGRRCAVCPADFDSDGGVTCADVAAFIAEYEAGEGCADVDNNGGVDGGDLAYFFSVFEAGGCYENPDKSIRIGPRERFRGPLSIAPR